MRIIKKILLVLAILFVAIAAIGYIFFPSKVHVERSAVINQRQDVMFNFMNNLSNWNSWSPWYEKDTTAKYFYEGPATGIGATLKWESNNKEVGKGQMKITESKPDSLIIQELIFMEDSKPAYGFYRLAPENGATKVTWGFDAEMGANPLHRIMGGFMDGLVGKDFERGLAKLKGIAESMQGNDTILVE